MATPEEHNEILEPSSNVTVSRPKPLSEEEIQQNLDKIRERVDKNSALVFRYRFHALFPDLTKAICDNGSFTLKDGYMLLREHKDYYQFALSLIIYMIDDGYASEKELDRLIGHVTEFKMSETDIREQRLNLWRMLSNIAAELNSEDSIRDVINNVGEDLNINTDHIMVDNRYSLASVLNAFRLLEEKGKLQSMLQEQSPEVRKDLYFYQLLVRCSFNKQISKYVDPFDPNRPLTVILLDVESKLTDT